MALSAECSICGALVGIVCALGSVSASAQKAEASIPQVRVSQVDSDAAREAGPGRIHGLAAKLPGAKQKLDAFHPQHSGVKPNSGANPFAKADPDDAISGPHFFPADLASGGGPTLQSTEFHAIYVNAPGSITSTWGDPEGFLKDLNTSLFIQITDQYVDSRGNNRYPVGSHASVKYGTPGVILYESDIAAIVHAVASQTGSGGGHVYHVFLPPGTDTCFAPPSAQNPVPVCYSPDNPATFAFCGYHDAVQFSDIGIALFTVEPWQGPGSGCEIATSAPNGVLIDSTDNVLSHESFETITDPLPGLGYSNLTGGLLTFNEIGDECVLFNFSNSPGAFTPPTFRINGKLYAVQTEYSNKYHACVTVP